MQIREFYLANEAKVRRVIEGTESAATHRLEGGLGLEAKPEDILAQYDRLGGLITVNGNKVKTGSFWDFENKKAFEEPQVVFEYRTEEGDSYEFSGKEPVQVQAHKAAKAKKAKKTKKAKDEE